MDINGLNLRGKEEHLPVRDKVNTLVIIIIIITTTIVRVDSVSWIGVIFSESAHF